MKSTFIFILFFIFLSISVSGQAPIPLSAMARSVDPLMTIQTNSSRYQNYKYFTTAWGDTLLNFMQANPNWLGTYLPAGAVNIAAAGNNLQFTQGGTLRWTSDTTSLGEWIPQFTVSPALSGGLINQRLIGVGSLANKYIGTSGQDNVGLYVDGYPDLYLRNSQIQDTALAAGNYWAKVDQDGKIVFVPNDSLVNIFTSDGSLNGNRNLNTKGYSVTFDSIVSAWTFNTNETGFTKNYARQSVNNTQQGATLMSESFTAKRNGGQSTIGTFGLTYNGDSTTRYGHWRFFTASATSGGSNQFSIFSRGGVTNVDKFVSMGSGADNYVSTSVPFATTMALGNQQVDFPIFGVGSNNGFGTYYMLVNGFGTDNITFPTYPSTRNDTELPDNMAFSKNADGDLGVKQLEDIFAIYNAQASSDLELVSTADSTTAYPLFSTVTKTNTDFYENQGDTVIFFKQPGVYRIDAGLIFETSGSTQSVNTILKFEPAVSYGRSFSIDANGDRTSNAYNAVVTISTAYTKLRISKQTGAIATTTFFGSDSRITIQRVY